MSNDILKKEIRFAVHLPKNDYREDTHFVREDITYVDGRVEPHTFLVKDYKRPVWTTKRSHQNHKEKKEFEYRDVLDRQLTTQSDINRTVANMLGTPHLASNIDAIKNSPYVYGYDITSTSLIKLTSLKKNEFVQSPYSVASFDIETDPRTNEIILITLAFGKRFRTVILKRFVKNIADVLGRVRLAIAEYLPDYVNFKWDIAIYDDEVSMLKDIFKTANDWAPTFLAIWNMDFDITKILDKLKQKNVRPTDVICDQSVPTKYRMCRYKRGMTNKVTASGLHKAINPSLQWHTLFCTSKFYVIDAMCVYRQLRMAKQEKTSYSLDNILTDELGKRKLKFDAAAGMFGLREHLFLQDNYPIEYIVYNIFDCIGMLELEAKLKDLSYSLPSASGITDFAKFSSQVRKVSDAVFLFGLEKNRILGTPPKVVNEEEPEIPDELLDDDEEEEFDEEDVKNFKTLDLKGWIQLLPQHLLVNEGLKCLEEYPEVTTSVRGISSDLDATSSYPSCTLVSNVSKSTCVNELIEIFGIEEEVFREQNLSMCLGESNMSEYFSVMFGMPTLDKMNEVLDSMGVSRK